MMRDVLALQAINNHVFNLYLSNGMHDMYFTLQEHLLHASCIKPLTVALGLSVILCMICVHFLYSIDIGCQKY